MAVCINKVFLVWVFLCLFGVFVCLLGLFVVGFYFLSLIGIL